MEPLRQHFKVVRLDESSKKHLTAISGTTSVMPKRNYPQLTEQG